jgi:hypothetical protein
MLATFQPKQKRGCSEMPQPLALFGAPSKARTWDL